MMWDLYFWKGSGSARLTKNIHHRFWLVSLPDALLKGTDDNWSSWKLGREKQKDWGNSKKKIPGLSLASCVFGPAVSVSCLSRSPAASGRYLCRSCGSFLRLTFASVECGQAADTVLCQEVNGFLFFPASRPLHATLRREPSSLSSASPTNTQKKLVCRSHSGLFGRLHMTNICRSFLPNGGKQQLWAGKSKE